MRLLPPVTAKQLLDAEPGELVRSRCFDKQALSLVARGRDSPYLVVLEKFLEDRPVPCYFQTLSHDPSVVVSFGKSYVVGDSIQATQTQSVQTIKQMALSLSRKTGSSCG